MTPRGEPEITADFHADRDSAWLVALAHAVAEELGIDRQSALVGMATVFGTASTDADGPFSPRVVVELERAALLCERLAAQPSGVTS